MIGAISHAHLATTFHNFSADLIATSARLVRVQGTKKAKKLQIGSFGKGWDNPLPK
jgi:hypothetical protein